MVNESATNATAEHDPYPRGFGDPILWYDNDDIKKLRQLSIIKCKRLERGKNYKLIWKMPIVKELVGGKTSKIKGYFTINKLFRNYVPSIEIKKIYLESTHAFIKSFGEIMYDLLPTLNLIHLTRNPLEVAKSFFNRNSIPGPNNPFLLDPKFKKNIIKPTIKLTNFQLCLWYWFESEARHVEFLKKHDIKKVYEIDVKEFNDKEKVVNLFNKFGITYRNLFLDVERNKNIKPTSLTNNDLLEAREFIDVHSNQIFYRIDDKYSLKENLLDNFNIS